MDFETEAQKPLVSDEDRVEIIMLVVDNDRDVATQCIHKILGYVKYPFKLVVYENSLNSMNTAKIWNKLIRESTCGYICLIDSDADPRNDFITEMMQVMKRHPEAAAVGPAGDSTSFIPDTQRVHDPKANEFPQYDDLSGFCFLFKKSIMDEYGYFDESFVFYGQDSEWTYRMALAQKPFYIVPRAYVNHKNSISSIRKETTDGASFRQLDAEYCRRIIAKYKDIDITKYNPWKDVIPYKVKN